MPTLQKPQQVTCCSRNTFVPETLWGIIQVCRLVWENNQLRRVHCSWNWARNWLYFECGIWCSFYDRLLCKFKVEVCKRDLQNAHNVTGLLVLMQHAWSGDSLPAVTFKKLHDLLFFFRPGISKSYQIWNWFYFVSCHFP